MTPASANDDQRVHDAFVRWVSLQAGPPRHAESLACVPLAREKLSRTDWARAANAILAARRMGVAPAELKPLGDVILTAALKVVDEAKRETPPVAAMRGCSSRTACCPATPTGTSA